MKIDSIEQHVRNAASNYQDPEEFEAAAHSYLKGIEELGMIQPNFKVDVRRNPHDPTSLLVDLEIRPPPVYKFWCWDCGRSHFVNRGEPYRCTCGEPLIHTRPKTTLDSMKETIDET